MAARDTFSPWPPEHLWIAGDGPLARSVQRLAETVEFAVTIFDNASDLAHCAPDISVTFPATPTLGVVLSPDPQEQIRVLSCWITKPFAFLGVMAAREARTVIFSEVVAKRFATKEVLERVVKPLGAGLGSVSIEELSISIVAELIQNRSERRISREAASRIRSPSLIKAHAA